MCHGSSPQKTKDQKTKESSRCDDLDPTVKAGLPGKWIQMEIMHEAYQVMLSGSAFKGEGKEAGCGRWRIWAPPRTPELGWSFRDVPGAMVQAFIPHAKHSLDLILDEVELFG